MTKLKVTWISFVETGDTGKTKIFRVENNEHGFNLGTIKWYGPFRQYSFFPADNCVFEKTCLQDITNFIKELMEARKKNV